MLLVVTVQPGHTKEVKNDGRIGVVVPGPSFRRTVWGQRDFLSFTHGSRAFFPFTPSIGQRHFAATIRVLASDVTRVARDGEGHIQEYAVIVACHQASPLFG